MRIALIIINYYSSIFLRQCLSCVAKQELHPAKVIIVNNGDHLSALDFVHKTYPDYELIESANIGFAAGNNLALSKVSDSDWVALLNPDAYPAPDWLSQLASATINYPGFDIFSSQLLNAANSNRIDGEGDSYHFSGIAWRRRHGQKYRPRGKATEIFSACGAAALFRKEIYLSANGFDERFFCYFEDVDLGFRLKLLGYRCLHVPQAVVFHVGSATSGGKHSDFAIYHGHRNLVWTYVKNMPGWLFWLFLPAHIMLNIISMVWFAIRGKWKPIWSAKRDAIRQLPAVWSERQAVQRSRKVSALTILRSLDFSLIRLPRGG